MALVDILAAIERDADAELATLRADAEREIAEARARAQALVDEQQGTLAATREADADAEVERIADGARLDAARLLRTAREEAYVDVRDRLAADLGRLRRTDRYASILGSLLDECRAALPAGTIVRVDPRDRELLDRLLRERGLERWRVEPELECLGGLELRTDDGRTVLDTLDARLVRADAHLRRVARALIPALATASP